MASQRLLTHHAALNIHRAFPDSGCPYHLRWSFMELHLRELINVPSRTHSAEISGIHQLLRHKVDDKFLCLLYYLIGISLRSDRYGYHRRIGIHRPRPCNCYNIRLFALPFTAHHNRRNRIEHIPRLPTQLCHTWLLSAL